MMGQVQYHFIVNPFGAAGSAMRTWHRAEKAAQKLGMNYVMHMPTDTYFIKDIVHDLTDTDVDTYIIIVGGDGSLNAVVNSIVNFDRTFIGFIPAGTGNDFARSLALHGSPLQILKRIVKSENAHTLDVGRATLHTCYDANNRKLELSDVVVLFNNGAGVGFDAQVCVGVRDSVWTSRLGTIGLSKLSYLMVAVAEIIHHKTFQTRIDCDGTIQHFANSLFATVMNEPYQGGGFKFCPDASPTDHMSDACVVDSLRLGEFVRVLPLALIGKHTTSKAVAMSRGAVYHLKTDEPQWFQTDGEVEYKTDDVTITVLPHKVHFMGIL
ncbi:diacylglycerol/lipid kinase family protein [Alloscardovia venturai]|uniref:diacylglycerol kinase (ATP) n=1 Tax=Alloscardovia venturai TaxID=1769421 RepID=A0ABW2Y4H2_9BIFI